MKYKKRRGSLTIFFCLVFSAMLLMLGIYLQAAQYRSRENDLNRAMAAQIKTSLASYEREWRQFGLFGFSAKSPDPGVFSASLPLSLRACKITIFPQRKLTDVDVLYGQIIKFMKGRVPAIYLDLFMERLSGSDQKTLYPQSGLPVKISAALGDLQGKNIKETASGLFGGLVDELKDQTMLELQETYRTYAAQTLGTSSDDALSNILGATPDFFDPQALSSIAGHLDQLITFKTAPIYEKCCLVEYILGEFRPEVQQMRNASGKVALKTLDGRTFDSLPDNRQAEVEKILTGFDNQNTASSATRVIITSLRSLLHFMAILADQTQIDSLRTSATTVTAAVAVLTGGTVVLDPEAVTYLLAAGKAIDAGMKDFRNLAAGNKVEIWPGRDKPEISLYYQDYIRLFLLAVPSDVLLARIAGCLETIMPEPVFTAVQVRTTYRNRTYQQSGGYQ